MQSNDAKTHANFIFNQQQNHNNINVNWYNIFALIINKEYKSNKLNKKYNIKYLK